MNQYSNSVAKAQRPCVVTQPRTVVGSFQRLSLITALCLVGACGQKGPLSHPGKTGSGSTAVSAPTPSAAASASATKQR
ncbi:MAG: LPS translocon maturation chaperone LptM [Burkholderiales bacterium]